MKNIDISGLEAFPDEPRVFEPEGKEFVILSDVYYETDGLDKGDIVKMERNNNSSRTLFVTKNGRRLWLGWYMIADIPKGKGA